MRCQITSIEILESPSSKTEKEHQQDAQNKQDMLLEPCAHAAQSSFSSLNMVAQSKELIIPAARSSSATRTQPDNGEPPSSQV
jgi:hypothetical protein